MAYLFRGTLHGLLCGDCIEALEGIVVRLYAVETGRDSTALAVAHAKDTFTPVSDEAVAAKAGRLLAEAVIDAEGNFKVDFSTAPNYGGEAFEIDIYCGTVPHRRPGPRPPTPMQFSITVLQPLWRTVGDDRTQMAVWAYTIPYRTWCAVRARFGAWSICGHVRHCETQAPIGGVRVKAFDVDWLQDDALGEAITDGAGHFRIDYLAEDFQRSIFSPLINIEWTGGPDLYFHIETLAGTPLLQEPSSRGRAPDRENIGPCFCTDLCLKEQPPNVDTTLPAFDALGGYLFASQLQPATGLTVGDNRAFYSTVRLNGILPKTMGGVALEYRFEVMPTDTAGNPAGPWSAITPAQFSTTMLGKLERYAPAFPGDPNPVKTAPVVVDPVNPAGGPLNAAIVGGWVQVPQFSNVFGAEGNFVSNGDMLNVITPLLANSPGIDVAGVVVGNSSTSAGAVLAQNRHIALRMRVRQVGNPGSEIGAGLCGHVAVENTLYANVHKGGSWAPVDVNGQLGVCSVDSLQLRMNGCAGIQAGLDVVLTTAHANLGAVSLSMNGPGGPYGFDLPAAVPGERFGMAVNGVAPPVGGWTVAGLPDCAYIITLSAQLLLTTGDSSPLPIQDQIAFCKK
ncbi:MAG TPA: hypothetical protein VLA16_17320 [Ideonella sp.]|nr:hypothetical protein [Ideonella sp.]